MNTSTLPSLHRQVIHRGYDRKSCLVHTRCGFLPDGTIIATLQHCIMGTQEDVWDLFDGISTLRSDDGGGHWSPLTRQPVFDRRREANGDEIAVSDFTPQWHHATGRLLGLGHTCRYRNGRLAPLPRRRHTVYSVFDPSSDQWAPIRLLEMPDSARFFSAGAGSIQWVEEDSGELLIPIYFTSLADYPSGTSTQPCQKVVVMRCTFDGRALRLIDMGSELSLPVHRGLGEPSLTHHQGRYHLTLRSGLRAYRCHSLDGLHYSPPEPWIFDNGQELGSYDTQAHWAQAGGRLFLVYTRRAENNAHVVRHRAPLFIAEYDPEAGHLLRETEQIAVPDRGAQLGNFGVAQSPSGEAWICASEWMENAGEWNQEVWGALQARYPLADLHALAALPGRCGLCELSGSDNSVHLVRVAL